MVRVLIFAGPYNGADCAESAYTDSYVYYNECWSTTISQYHTGNHLVLFGLSRWSGPTMHSFSAEISTNYSSISRHKLFASLFSGFPYLYLLVLTEMRLSKVVLWHVDFSGFKFHCRSRVALFSTVSSAMTLLFMQSWMELASFVRASSSSSFLENF